MNKKHDPVLQSEAPAQSGSAIDVDGERTPITNQEIKPVDANMWPEMTVSELYDQLAILDMRRLYCLQYSPSTAPQIERGISQLHQIINNKTAGELKLI